MGIVDIEYNKYNFYLEVASGNIPGKSIVHKFGRDPAVGTSFKVISLVQTYWTPTVGAKLRIKAGGNAADTIDGVGAQQVTIIGLDSTTFEEVTEVIDLAGASASAASSNTYIRFYRAYVSRSGTYATSTAGSHTADITIETSGGVAVGLITATDFSMGQTQTGAFTIPAGKTGYVLSLGAYVDSGKSASLLFFQRSNIDDVTTPFTGIMRLVEEYNGITGALSPALPAPLGPYPEKTDIGFLGKVSATTGAISVNFSVLLVDN